MIDYFDSLSLQNGKPACPEKRESVQQLKKLYCNQIHKFLKHKNWYSQIKNKSKSKSKKTGRAHKQKQYLMKSRNMSGSMKEEGKLNTIIED